MSAYSDLYVDDAMANLGEMMYSGVRLMGLDGADLYRDFAYSDIGRLFSEGNPRLVTGMSGFELLERLLYSVRRVSVEIPSVEDMSFLLSDEYNVGCALAYYQWQSGKGFRALYNLGLTMDAAVSALLASDADLDRFADRIDMLVESSGSDSVSTLARLRAYWEWSQRELSERSGVSLRSIQLYEQGQNDISRAGADVVYRLSRSLGCSMEELMER